MDVMNQQMSIILFFHFKTNKPVDRKNIIFDSNILLIFYLNLLILLYYIFASIVRIHANEH